MPETQGIHPESRSENRFHPSGSTCLVERHGSIEIAMVGQRYRAKTTPHMYVINPAGQLVYNGAIDNSPNGRPGGEYQNFVSMALECVAEGREIDFGARPYGCGVKYASGGGKGGGRRRRN